MIGERLEDARKRKGVSIREVAEATKIRGDYLLSMEDNTFDIPLPQIYIRGFLKNYARYLKLDPNKILTDYDAHLLGKTSRPVQSTTRSGASSLGQMQINEDEDQDSGEKQAIITEAPEDDGPEPELSFSLDREKPRAEVPAKRVLKSEGSLIDQDVWNENKALYMKIGLVFVAILLFSIILIVLIQMLGGKDDTPEINPELARSSTPVLTEPTRSATTTEVATTDTISITASDNLTLIVEQTLDRKRLYSGTLNTGESLSLEKEGPVSIRFSNGSALVIEKDGQRFTPPQGGVGRTVVE
ncbi:MAG: RodZ domain-containing protein [Opitutales bacterium]|jgi:cytoskeleton protein RodZ